MSLELKGYPVCLCSKRLSDSMRERTTEPLSKRCIVKCWMYRPVFTSDITLYGIARDMSRKHPIRMCARAACARQCEPVRGCAALRGRVGSVGGVKQMGIVGPEALGSLASQLGLGTMPPFTCQHLSRQSRSGSLARSALATTAAYNWSLGTDTQPKAAAARRGLRAGQLQRYPVTDTCASG